MNESYSVQRFVEPNHSETEAAWERTIWDEARLHLLDDLCPTGLYFSHAEEEDAKRGETSSHSGGR